MTDRCPTCDRPKASPQDWENVPEGEGEHLCWGGTQCTSARVDWRERALKAESTVDELLQWAEEMRCEMEADDFEGYDPKVCSPHHSGRCWPCEARVRLV